MSHFFKNLKFRTKLFIICLMISLVPTLVLGIFCYNQLQTLLIEREETAMQDSIIQEKISISSQLSSYEDISEYVVWDSNLIDVLSRNYETNSQMFRAYNLTVEPFFTTLKHLSPNINEIIIYTDLEIYPRLGVLEPLSKIEAYPWYPQVKNSVKPVLVYSPEENNLFIVRRFIDIPSNISAFIWVGINSDALFSRLKTLFNDSYGIMLFDNAGNSVWNFYTEDIQTPPASLLDLHHSNFVVESTTDTVSGWTYYVYRPSSVVFEATRPMVLIILSIIFACLLFVIFLSYWLSSSLVRPLEKLAANMNQVAQGNYETSVEYQSSDEIGQLINNFTEMVQKINHLINETLRGKIIQHKLEYRALQAQINPHFLYNTLSLINSQAILDGYPKLGLPARYLATFYRTSLNKGKDLIKVKDELANIQAYINIQLLIHSDSFDVIYHINEEIYDYTMPNLMLQPLVENAILHGIDNLENLRKGHLEITATAQDENLIFTIADNGLGIPENKLATLLTERSGSYGIENVHTRAQLQYGSRFGLKYHSQTGSGTQVTLTIPKQSATNVDFIL